MFLICVVGKFIGATGIPGIDLYLRKCMELWEANTLFVELGQTQDKCNSLTSEKFRIRI